MSYTYSPIDTYWGQLSGCLEAIHAGTTTVLDHAHIAYSVDHGEPNPTSAINNAKESFLSNIRTTCNHRLRDKVHLCQFSSHSS